MVGYGAGVYILDVLDRDVPDRDVPDRFGNRAPLPIR
jgi:hypothetical protein